MKPLRYLLLITAALAAVIFFIAFLDSTPSTTASSASSSTQQPISQTPEHITEHTNELHRQEAVLGAAERREARIQQMHQLLQDNQQNPGNLAATLQQLRQQCTPDDDCDALIQDMLSRYPDQAFASLVEQAMLRLPLYESSMQDTVLSTSLPPRERYDTIHQLREQALGPDITEAMFGQEKAWAEYQFRYGELMSSGIEGLSPSQRLSALNSLREQSFGEYAESLKEIEGVDGRYQRELEMLLEGVSDSTQRQQITDQLRSTHYGNDIARQMQERDARLQTQQQQVDGYQQELQAMNTELESLKSSMPESDWQRLHEQRLTELKLRHFSH